MEANLLQGYYQSLNGSLEVTGTGDRAEVTVDGDQMNLQLLVKEILARAHLPHVFDLCEPFGSISVHLHRIPCEEALPLILNEAGYHCAKRVVHGEPVWVIADGGPAASTDSSSKRAYKQYTPARIQASSLRDNLLLGSFKTPALWPQGNSTGLAVGLSPESNRIFLTGPQQDVQRTLQILQCADQAGVHVLLDVVMIYLKEQESQELYAKLDLSGGPLFLTGLGNTTENPLVRTTPSSGVIDAAVSEAVNQPFRISTAADTPLKALLQSIEDRQIVRAQLLVQSGQQASLQIGRNGYLLLTTYSESQPSVQSQHINAGSTISITPKVLPQGRVRVNANLSVARFEPSGFNLAANTISFQTVNTFEARSGEPVLLSGGVICFATRGSNGYAAARNLPALDFLTSATTDVLQDFHLIFILTPRIIRPSLTPQGIEKAITIPLLDAVPGVDNTGYMEGG